MRKLLTLLFGLALAPYAVAIDTPSTLLITGNVLQGGGVTPAIDDSVIVFNPATKSVVGKGKVLSDRGLFSVTLSLTSAFDGTPVTLQFQKNGRRYQLYEGGAPLDGGTPADFVFQGGLVPRRATTTATIGEEVGLAIGEPNVGDLTGGSDSDQDSSNGDNNGGIVTPTTPEPQAGSPFDVNDDDVVDQLDVQAVKDVVAGRPVSNTIAGRADVNRDEIVNTRDIIAVIKAVNRAERERLRTRTENSIRRP
jgi:hypothetical protein